MSIDSDFHHTVEVLNNSLRPLRSKNEELEQFQSKKPHFRIKKKPQLADQGANSLL